MFKDGWKRPQASAPKMHLGAQNNVIARAKEICGNILLPSFATKTPTTQQLIDLGSTLMNGEEEMSLRRTAQPVSWQEEMGRRGQAN